MIRDDMNWIDFYNEEKQYFVFFSSSYTRLIKIFYRGKLWDN